MNDALHKLQKEHYELVRQLTNHKTQEERENLEKRIDMNETEQKRLSNKHPRELSPRGKKKRSLIKAILGLED